MDWLKPLDFYCERTTADFWAEPLNAVSNAAFLAAAVTIFMFANSDSSPEGRFRRRLSYLIGTVGIGSFLFHTFANRITHLADLLPILIFLLSFAFIKLRSLGKSKKLAVLSVGAFISVTVAFEVLCNQLLNGSLLYLPTLLLLIFFNHQDHLKKKSKSVFHSCLPSLAFFISLLARTIDSTICEDIPVGSHFLWHTFNAIVMFMATQTLTEESAS